ncbi:MAG: DUF4091 domain-containing protein [Pseudomonadota bacterium]
MLFAGVVQSAGANLIAVEYVTNVRLTAPSELVVDRVETMTIEFLDATGRVVPPEPGRVIQLEPAGIHTCVFARCADVDFETQFVTQPGVARYTIYARSLVAGFVELGVVHPNGSEVRELFSSERRTAPPPPPTQALPTAMQLAGDPPGVSLGGCASVQVDLVDANGQVTAAQTEQAIVLNPGGGIYVSTDGCASYRNAPVVVPAGQSRFSFQGYVLSADYAGTGIVVLESADLDNLRVAFATGNGSTPAPEPPAPPEPEPPAPEPPTGGVSVWANDGGDKVLRERTRSFSQDVRNCVWDGQRIKLFAARNETVSFNVVVDNAGSALSAVRVAFDRLDSADYALASRAAAGDNLFDWRERPIEVFAVGYLKIHGLSRIAYELYDETHTPEGLRRPFELLHPQGPAIARGPWSERPNHDLSYPDIAVPVETQPATRVETGNSQSFWVDVYVPKDAPAGMLSGLVRVTDGSNELAALPVELEVLDLTLPDESAARSMVYLDQNPLAERYLVGEDGFITADADKTAYRRLVDRHYQMAWRHRISLIDGNELVVRNGVSVTEPHVDWQRRLRGELYTPAFGYAGPGSGRPHDVFSIGTYGLWTRWWGLTQYDPTNWDYDSSYPESLLRSTLNQRTDEWENWFLANAPTVDRFLYVDDEPATAHTLAGDLQPIEYAEQISRLVKENSGVGGNLDTFITASPLEYDGDLPSTSILGDVIAHGQTNLWTEAVSALRDDPRRGFYMYNGRRPASGTFVIDDDGVALRELAWGQYKVGIERWYYWHSTYYDNFQGGSSSRYAESMPPGREDYRRGSQTNVFRSAHTFGGHTNFDGQYGETGWNYSNGDGVLFYPGTDLIFPAESRGLMGPIASLRLKHWRRGVQDVEYLRLAMAKDPAATRAIISELVPEVMWELGVFNTADPTYVHKAPSWPTDPDVWEDARRRLAEIALQ